MQRCFAALFIERVFRFAEPQIALIFAASAAFSRLQYNARQSKVYANLRHLQFCGNRISLPALYPATRKVEPPVKKTLNTA